MAVFVFGSLAAAEFLAAFRTQSATRVWFGEVLVGLAVAYLAMFRVISLGHGFSMFAVMGASLGCWVLSRLAVRNATVRVIAEAVSDIATPSETFENPVDVGIFIYGTAPATAQPGLATAAGCQHLLPHSGGGRWPPWQPGRQAEPWSRPPSRRLLRGWMEPIRGLGSGGGYFSQSCSQI